MEGEVDLVGILDAFLHGLRLPPGLVLGFVVQVGEELARELVHLAYLAGPLDED